MSVESVMPSNHLISVVSFSSCLQSFPAPGSFPMSVLCIGWPKYWNFSISPSSEYSGLISFRIDCFDHLAEQGTLKSLLQHYSTISSSVLSLFYCLALTSGHDYWKNHSFDDMDFHKQNNVSAFFNVLSRFIIAFLPRSKTLNFMAAVTVHSDFGT